MIDEKIFATPFEAKDVADCYGWLLRNQFANQRFFLFQLCN